MGYLINDAYYYYGNIQDYFQISVDLIKNIKYINPVYLFIFILWFFILIIIIYYLIFFYKKLDLNLNKVSSFDLIDKKIQIKFENKKILKNWIIKKSAVFIITIVSILYIYSQFFIISLFTSVVKDYSGNFFLNMLIIFYIFSYFLLLIAVLSERKLYDEKFKIIVSEKEKVKNILKVLVFMIFINLFIFNSSLVLPLMK